MLIVEERIAFAANGDAIEGIAAYPDTGSPHTAILVLSPHPQMGGNMENNVVRHIARRAAEDGALSVRFNYRGVGRSVLTLPVGTSRYDYFQRMEAAQNYEVLLPDARAAHVTMNSLHACLRMIYVGYSLGCVVGGMLAHTQPPNALIAISPPVKTAPLTVFDTDTYPRYFLGGDHDFAFVREIFLEQYARLPEPKQFQILEGADHFFRKEEERIYCVIKSALFAR